MELGPFTESIASPLVTAVTALLFLLFPLMALAGFFEQRTDGFCFKTKRFVFISFLFLLIAFTPSLLVVSVSGFFLEKAGMIAQEAVEKNRAAAAYAQKNLTSFFPAVFTQDKATCYRAALSNYIEDGWNNAFRTSLCETTPDKCPLKQEEYFFSLRQEKNPFGFFFGDLSVIGDFLPSIWSTAKSMYDQIRSHFQEPSQNGQIFAPLSPQEKEAYLSYFNRCEELTPTPWADPNQPLFVRSLSVGWQPPLPGLFSHEAMTEGGAIVTFVTYLPCLFFLLGGAGILVLTHRPLWATFAARHKVLARFTLAFFLLTQTLALLWIIWTTPYPEFYQGHFTPEQPNATITAVKLGLYNLYTDYELASQAPELKEKILCVGTLSRAHAEKGMKSCKQGDYACLQKIPVLSKEEMEQKIHENKAGRDGLKKIEACANY